MSILKPKIILKEKGQSAITAIGAALATLRWKKDVDLDLHAFYAGKTESSPSPAKKSFLGKLFSGSDENSTSSRSGHIYFSSMGSSRSFPYIQLDQDAGVGDTGGDNEENMRIHKLAEHDHILIVANRYGKQDKFSNFDGSVFIKGGDEEFEVPLSSKEVGSYCIVAHIDNTSTLGAKITNINLTMRDVPNLQDFLAGKYS